MTAVLITVAIYISTLLSPGYSERPLRVKVTPSANKDEVVIAYKGAKLLAERPMGSDSKEITYISTEPINKIASFYRKKAAELNMTDAMPVQTESDSFALLIYKGVNRLFSVTLTTKDEGTLIVIYYRH